MKNPFVRGFNSSYLGNWFALFELGMEAAAEHLSAGPSVYGGGGLSPASGTVESFNEQLYIIGYDKSAGDMQQTTNKTNK